jgi:glutamine synthetase type III
VALELVKDVGREVERGDLAGQVDVEQKLVEELERREHLGRELAGRTAALALAGGGGLDAGAHVLPEVREEAVRVRAVELLQQRRDALEAAMKKFDETSAEAEKAVLLAGPVSEAMLEVRAVCDELESIMDDSRWPLPKYREMLFLA